jgi:hypothetical protein
MYFKVAPESAHLAAACCQCSAASSSLRSLCRIAQRSVSQCMLQAQQHNVSVCERLAAQLLVLLLLLQHLGQGLLLLLLDVQVWRHWLCHCCVQRRTRRKWLVLHGRHLLSQPLTQGLCCQ